MGCTASRTQDPATRLEDRPKELDKCASVSSDVRWAWLRGRTLFTFAELRVILKLYQTATASGDDMAVVGTNEEPSDPEISAPYTAAPSFTTTEAGDSVSGKESTAGPMNKRQFLAACKLDEAFRLSEVVGTFGSRLFDVLDRNVNGELEFEDFAMGMSTLLKGPESEKLKMMYAAYDISGVAPSEERKRGGDRLRSKSKLPKGSKYLTMEDMVTVLTSVSQDVFPTLLSYTRQEHRDSRAGSVASGVRGSSDALDGIFLSQGVSDKSTTFGQVKEISDNDGGIEKTGALCSSGEESQPEALKNALEELARRNASSFAKLVVSEFGRAHEGTLNLKEFERWASTGPVLRCRLHEFSLDVNVVPFQGVRMA